MVDGNNYKTRRIQMKRESGQISKSQNDASLASQDHYAERRRSVKKLLDLDAVSKFFDTAEHQEGHRLGLPIIVVYTITIVGMFVWAYLAMKLASYFYIL